MTPRKFSLELSQNRTADSLSRFLRATLFVVAVVIFASPFAQAANVYWNTMDGDWSTPANWGGTAPTSSDEAYINNGGCANVIQSNATCNVLHLDLGTLQISAGGTFTSAIIVGNGTFRAGVPLITSVPMTLTGTGNTAYFDTNGKSLTISGLISGSGGLTKIGSGVLTLSAENTYSGDTAISSGSITLNNNNALQNSTLDYGSGGGTLNFNSSSASAILGGLKGDLGLALSYGTFVNAVALSVGNNGQSTTFNGVLSSYGSLNKIGAGTLTLTAANTFSGTTKISGGVLVINNANALQNSTLDYNSYGGSLSFGSVTNASIATLKGNQTLTLNNNSAAAVALTVGSGNQSAAYSGSINGLGSLTKVGTGTLTLSGSNNFSGDTTISGGVLRVTSDALQFSTLNYLASGGALSFISPLTSATFGGLKGDRDLPLSYIFGFNTYAVALSVGNNGQSSSYSGGLSGTGSLTKVGSGTLALTGANTYTGNTVVSAGALQAKKTASLPGYNATGKITVNSNAALVLNAGGTGEWAATDIQTLIAKATFNANSTLGIDTTDGDFAYPNALAGNISFTKLGSDSLTLTGALTYSGTTTINGGTLCIATPVATQPMVTLYNIVGSGDLVVGDGVNETQLTATSICVGSLTINGTQGAMTAVPEPSTLVLLATTLAICVLPSLSRKRR